MVLMGPHPLRLDTLLLLPLENPMCTLRFVLHLVHHKLLGGGGGWEGGSMRTDQSGLGGLKGNGRGTRRWGTCVGCQERW